MVRKMKRGKVSFIESIMQGALGKQFVIKHYRYGIIKTKFPDMTRIKASAGQRKCRNTFAEAVEYAKTVMADTQLKKDWQKRLRRRNGVWNEAIKYYLLKIKQARHREKLLTDQLIRQALNNDPPFHISKPAPVPVNVAGSIHLQEGAPVCPFLPVYRSEKYG